MTKVKKTAVNSEKKEKRETVLISSSDSYYDDCPVCQAMKKAEEEGRSLSEEELKEAFTKANKEQRQN